MIHRRSFIRSLLATAALSAVPLRLNARYITMSHEAVIVEARKQGWTQLPIGALMGKIGEMFISTPYVGGTLEGPGPEVCRVFYDKLDCVTYFELVLALARTIKASCWDESDVVREITRTRYRNGVLDGYLSRLHYTSDWISDNVSKGVVENVTTNDEDAEPFENTVNFMSSNVKYYRQLREDPELVSSMKQIEQQINQQKRWFVPKDSIKDFEPRLQTGDIVAVATLKPGLDYAHTGLIRVDDLGQRRFMHASTTVMRVELGDTISNYVNSVKTHTGITVVRPLEPDFGCAVEIKNAR